MYQTKVSLTEPLAEFLTKYRAYGFKDKSSMVRAALDQFHRELETQKLKESAELYAELYESDEELQMLAEASFEGWPE